ncbi:hypothetical protein GQ600_5769 [Phytophthora cactorum]|nr:hypothetical protein GQ600_5769 [Phytophthora cactorum]
MARTRVEPPRTTAHVLSWLRRGRREEIPVELVLDVIRSVHGVIPLGGPLSLFSAGKDAKDAGDASQDQSDDKRWTILLSSVQLPASGGQQELRNALEALHDDKQSQKPLDIETLRRKFFAERRDFFAVRVELLRAASNPQHPNAQVAEEAVDELLKEGLREALLDEVHGRQFTQQPSFTGVGAAERKALVAWELQFLEEEALLRELLLLTLVASREKATLESALKITKTVYNWEARVFDEVFTVSTLALPAAQETARKLTQVGLLVALRLLHSTGAVQEHAALQQVTKSFFLTELCGVPDSTSEEPVVSPVPGVLLLAWATLLGRQYREVAGFNRETQEVKELEVMLQHTLAAAEHRHSFHYLNALLRSLVFRNDYGDSDSTAFLHPLSLHAKKLWTLPSVAASAGLRGAKTTPSPYLSRDSASIYQHVVAAFLSDMLSSLGYMENLDVALQLHAMVKFVLPALSNARVAQQTLGIDAEESNMTDIVASGETAALRDLLTKARANLPHSLLSCVQMFTALCCSYQDVSSPAVLRQVLKYFNKPRAGLEGRMITSGVCRPAPPAEYISEIAGVPGRVTCTRSFAYDDEDSRLVVPAGTRGTIVQSGEEVQIEWLLADSDEDKHASSLWDLLMLSADSFVAGLQSGSFANLHPRSAARWRQVCYREMKRRWGEARLRRWWTEHRLPSPEYYVPQLVRQQIALSTLLSASRENLVSWDIRDRHVREQILAQIGSVERHDFGSVIMGDASTMNSFTVDGGIHLLRLLLGVLDGFLHASPGAADAGESAWAAGHLHLVAASFIALRTLLATTSGVELLMNASLGGGREECVNLIVKSAKKLFELHERLTGEYPVVLATQEIFMSVVRWFLSKEAQGLADPASTDEGSSGSHAFVAMERLWFVGAAEFAIEVLSTHESWKFVSTSERCEVTERCFRLLYVLVLPRKYIHEQNEMAPAFETALRETLSTDMSLLMKLLRSSCALLSSMEGQLSGDDEETNSEVDESDTDDDTAVDFVQFESLVTTCLRFVALLLSNEKNGVDTQAARKILLTPIDGGSKTLTIVTLCGVYLGTSSRAWHVCSAAAGVLATSAEEVIELLTLCLEHQPGFLALLFGIDSKKAKNDDKEARLRETPCLSWHCWNASSRLQKSLEQSSDLFCALLAFLVQVWEGAIHKGLGVHLEIMAALRARSTFWPNVSRALKIHMPLESVEERGLLDMELAAATAQGRGAVESPSSSSELYIGRSSAYGYLARGLILQLVSLFTDTIGAVRVVYPTCLLLKDVRYEPPQRYTRRRHLHRRQQLILRRRVKRRRRDAQAEGVDDLVASTQHDQRRKSFNGDRTSFGMIQVLVDVIKIRVNQHENQDETLDFFVLVHLHDLVQLLVSMLHHQLCLVVRKTRDPKLSQTRQRLEGSKDSNLKFDTGATLELLSVIEKTASAVHDAMKQIARELELMRLGANSNSTLASSIELSAVPLIARLVTDFERKVESVTDELYTSLFTAALLLVRHLSKINRHPSRINDGDTNMESMSPPKPLLQVKLIGHCMNAISLCDDRPQSTRSTQALFQLSWCLFQEVLDSFSSVDSAKPKLRMANAVQLNPFVKELEHDQQGVGALFHLLVQRFRPSCNSKQVAARQEEAYQVLRGLTAVVWNPANTELCQRVMLKASSSRSSSRLRLLSMLATELLPLLQTQMEREETSSKLRGYVSSLSSEADDDMEEKSLDRSLAHRMWCLVLDFVGGLLRMPSSVDAEDADVWEFMSHAEALLLAAVQPTNCQRLTRAGVTEHQAVLRLLSALSGTASRRQRWRQAFPTNVVVLMEQSRQLLGRSCVLLGSSSAEMTRLRKEKTQKQKVKSPTKAIAVREVEKRKLTDFHREMEWELVEIVRLSSLLLAKWTASLTDRDAILVVDGVRYVDEDQLVPLLAFIPPSEARSMNSSPGLGHLSLAMDFMLDELLADEDTQTNATEKTKAVLANAIDSCALLFLKTYLLHAEQFELAKRDRDELKNFFRQFNARLSGCDGVDIDAQLLEHIGKIIAGV